MKSRSRLGFAFLLLVVILASCQPADPDISNLQASSTAAIRTVEALSTLLAANVSPTARQATSPSVQSTTTPLKTNTVEPLLRTPTLTPTLPGSWNECDNAAFISETIRDGAELVPLTPFTKSWILENTGTCTWTNKYALVFESGDPMSASMRIPIITTEEGTVSPGQSIKVSAPMVAPADFGDYMGFWKLENAKGIRFGIGPEGKAFWVRVVVTEEVLDEFLVKSVFLNVDFSTYVGSCGKNGHQVNYTAWIKTNKAGPVTYYWITKEGQSEEQTIQFSGADTLEVYYHQRVKKVYYEGFVSLFIVEPNNQKFGKEKFTVTCTDR